MTYQAFTVAEIQQMILEGTMTDAKTISAVMSYAAKFLYPKMTEQTES